jgi:hypothetical protein
MLATLPGLPMLGHGQVQGFGEKYGMEFRRATLQEQPDWDLVARHEREIFPLLHRRAWFAEAHDFLLYDFVRDDGGIDENVFAYSNGHGPERSVVVFHNRFASTSGWIRESAAYAEKAPDGTKRQVRRSLAEGLGLPNEPGAYVILRDARTGLEALHSCREIWQRGLHLSLDAYSCHVFWELREVSDGAAGMWARLAGQLGGSSVPSVDDAMRELQLEPVHVPLRAVFADGLARVAMEGRTSRAPLAELERRLGAFFDAVCGATGVDGDARELAKGTRERIEGVFGGPLAPDDHLGNAALLGWLIVGRSGSLAAGADVRATSRAWYEELRLAPAMAAGLRDTGLDEGEAWAAAELIRVLLALPRPSGLRGAARTADARLLDQWLASDVVRTAIGVNSWDGVDYLDRDAFEAMLRWAARLDAIDADQPAPDESLVRRLSPLAEEAGYRIDRLKALVTAVAAPRRVGAPAGPRKQPKKAP